jgi:hypothetical protein
MFWKKRKSESGSGFTKPSRSGLGNADFGAEEGRDSYWDKLTQVQVSENAVKWFEEFQPTDFRSRGTEVQVEVHEDFIETIHKVIDQLSGSSTDPDGVDFGQIVKAVASDYNPTVFPDMEFNPAALDSIDIGQSKLGKKLLAALDKAGIAYGTSPGNNSGLEPSIFMRFQDTPADNLNLQYLRIYEDESGKECAYWHVQLLASNRPIDYRYIAASKGGKPFADGFWEGARFSSPEGEYNMKWVIPALMKDVAFLAENPFPSSAGLISFSRDLGFDGAPAKARPKPAFAIVRDEMFRFTHDSDEWEFNDIKPPHTLLFGWMLTEDSLAEFGKVLPVISSGCAFALSLFEEGEQERIGIWNGMDWDMKLRQPSALSSSNAEKYGQRYPAEWMTIPEYSRRHALVVEEYDDVYGADRGSERRERFEDLILHGADRYALHAANSLVFGEYLNSVISDEAELETALEILAMAFHLDPDDVFGDAQATNALSNAGVLCYQAGKLDLAERTLLHALERASGEDKASQGNEACFVLSLVYEELGKPDKADEAREMSEELGGYRSGSKLRRPAVGPSKAKGSSSGRKFCTNCGQAFLKTDQKFCPGCGTKK